MASGGTLWEALLRRYDLGVRQVEQLQLSWAALAPHVDAERFEKTAELLEVQRREAQWWRDACIAFFRSVSGLPLPADVAPPEHPLGYSLAIDNPYAPG
jgi:alpha-glucuronidase